jgi:hypothetical protein
VHTSAFANRMRRSVLWSPARELHRRVSAVGCGAVHRFVTTLGPRRAPAELVLKHRYDYHPIWVDPRSITRSLEVGEWRRPVSDRRPSRFEASRRWLRDGGGWKSTRLHLTRNVQGRFVAGGDWDRAATPLILRPTVRQLFLEGLPYRQTDEYEYLRVRVEAGRLARTRGCRTIEELDAYFETMIATYDAIRRTGYRSQAELGLDGSDEIRVCVTRDGELTVFGGGTHRLAMAQILDVKKVPVVVKRVHAAWVATWIDTKARGYVVAAVDRGIAALQAGGLRSRTAEPQALVVSPAAQPTDEIPSEDAAQAS